MKTWIYVENKIGCLLVKIYENPEKIFDQLKALGYLVATKQKSEFSVVYRVY